MIIDRLVVAVAIRAFDVQSRPARTFTAKLFVLYDTRLRPETLGSPEAVSVGLTT